MNRRRIALACSAIALSLLLAACNPAAEPGEAARTYLSKGDFAAARIEATNAIQANPNDAEAHVLLGTSLAALGVNDTAERALAKAAELGADRPRIDALRAPVLLKMRAYARVLEELVPTPAHQGNNLAVVLTARGKAHLALAQPAEAKAAFEAALKLQPGTSDALLGLAHLGLRDQDIQTAAALTEQALAKSPGDAGALNFKAGLLRLQNKTEDAIATVEQAVSANPSDLRARIAAAELLIEAGRFDSAGQHIAYVLRAAPKSPAGHHAQALLYFRQKNFDKTLESLQTALQAQPTYSPSLVLLAITYLARGELNQAEERLRALVQALPDDVFARKLYATTLMRMGNAKGALDTLAPALERSADDPALLTLTAQAHTLAKDYTRATAYYERIARLRATDPAVMTRLGLTRYAAGGTKEGLAALESAAALDTDTIGADFSLVLLQLERREFDKALAAAERIQRKQPQSPIGFNLAGAVQRIRGDQAAARKSFEQALTRDAGYWPAASNLARLHMASGQPDAAKKLIEQVLAKHKDSIEAMQALAAITGNRGQLLESLETARQANAQSLPPRLALARTYIALNLGAKALPVAREAVAIAPGQPETVEVLADAQYAAGLKTEALSTFRRLVTLAPKSARAHVRVGNVQSALEDPKGAEQSYRKALALSAHDPEALSGLARLHARSGRFADASAIAADMTRRQPGSATGHVLAGDVFVAQRRYDDALKAYDTAWTTAPSASLLMRRYQTLASAGRKPDDAMLEQWLARHPQDMAVRLYLANWQYMGARYAEAIANYRAVASADTRNATALNNLASAYLKVRDPLALSTAQAASALMPDDGNILDTLGVALMENGDTERALETLKKAIARNPDSAETRMHLAAALARSGDKPAARMELRRMVESGQAEIFDADAKALLATP